MSGFSADWLKLREPVDAVSRNPELTAELRAWRQRCDVLTVLDLGSGTGANFRFLAPVLAGEQYWRLVDHDSALLRQSDHLLRRWAAAQGMAVTDNDGTLILESTTGRYRLEQLRLDLLHDWERLDFQNVRLVTASALIDLASSDWLEHLARRCGEGRAAVFITLSYNGSVYWEPALEDDAKVCALLNRHQRTDKGFGPALGPLAAYHLNAALEDLGYRVELQPSPWRLGSEQAAMQTTLLEGWVEAARQLAPASAAWLDHWSAQRRRLLGEGNSQLRVGHWDLFARLDGI